MNRNSQFWHAITAIYPPYATMFDETSFTRAYTTHLRFRSQNHNHTLSVPPHFVTTYIIPIINILSDTQLRELLAFIHLTYYHNWIIDYLVITDGHSNDTVQYLQQVYTKGSIGHKSSHFSSSPLE